LEEPADFEHVLRISGKVDYMIEVQERSARVGRRGEIARGLKCALGSVGGVFAEPPMHWDRLRWFLPCGLASARALRLLHTDGGRACEYYDRPFANPVEEVSWRTGAAILSRPGLTPEQALAAALNAVYGAEGATLAALGDWFSRAEAAYSSRASFQPGDGPISLEPLWWDEDPAAAGPPIYLRDRLSPLARREYADDLRQLKVQFEQMTIPNQGTTDRTLASIDGTLKDIATLAER
jgi:hypothetical protein